MIFIVGVSRRGDRPRGLVQIGVTGFEPATSWSQTTRSTKLSYTPRPCVMHITTCLFAHLETDKDLRFLASRKQRLAGAAHLADTAASDHPAARRLLAFLHDSSACL